ncbi:hypothetical protein [Anaerotignum sp.]
MVEIQNISINDLMKNEKGEYINEIRLTPTKQLNSKNLASESELHRILFHLYKQKNGEPAENNSSGYQIVPYLFILDISKNKKRYDKLIECNGEIYITNLDYELDENGNKILDEKNHYVYKVKDSKKYVSTFCGAGHSRTQKNLFIDAEIVDDLNKIILCGMPDDLKYDRPSKWNAYYAMVTTDSTPVTYMPNIVVIPDYEKTVEDVVDVVEVSGQGEGKQYAFKKKCQRELPVIPFDGAGLVTPECAEKWAKELGCKSKKGESYLPSCFQFRTIAGIKGEVMLFDLKAFAREKRVSKIVDLGGKEWDLFDDEIDVILTASQFKFWKQYCDADGNFDYCKWRNAFEEKCCEYARTFNIVSYADHPEDLRKTTMLSYQPLQTVNFEDDEIKEISSKGLSIYQRITSDVDEFLKYRQLIVQDDTGEEHENTDEYTPAYYKALLKDKSLFNDRCIRGKVETDIKKLKNNLLSGKVFVKGNYQVFMPDLYGLAEWTFSKELGEEPKGLLGWYEIYSSWWNDQNVTEVDMIRNPAVGMEHRICQLKNTEEMKKWYRYQTTGIVTSMHDTLALVLGNADFDGDTVCTTDSQPLIDAVKRERNNGNGNLVWKEVVDTQVNEGKKTPVSIKDRAALMKVNQMSFENSIGTVIDRVTDLWSMLKQDEELIRKYIAYGVIVGGETIDFAKTGEKASFPLEMKNYFKGKKKGHWMRYLPKNQEDAAKEQNAIKQAKLLGKSDADIQKLKKFEDYGCNMDKLSHYAEKRISDMNCKWSVPADTFDFTKLIRGDSVISNGLKAKVKELQLEYQEISKTYRKEAIKSKTHQKSAANKYRWFYERCRMELLVIQPDINELVDALIKLYYGAARNSKDFVDWEKDILWNAFGDEMIARCCDKEISNVDIDKIKKYQEKNEEYKKKAKQSKTQKKRVKIHSIDDIEDRKNRVVSITMEDRKQIKEIMKSAYEEGLIKKESNRIHIQRVLCVLLYISRKFENEKTKNPLYFTKYNNVPDEITNTTIGKLADVNDKEIMTILKFLEYRKLIECKVATGGIKIKVLFNHQEGKTWIETADYNKAATQIRDYFRNKKS